MSRNHKRRGHVSRRSDGRWIAVASLGFDPLTGKRQRLYSSHKTRREAEEALTTMLRDNDQGRAVVPSRLTVAEFLSDWLAGRKVDLRPSAWASYDSNLRTHIAPRLGTVKLQKVTAATLARFYAALVEGGLSAKSARNVHVLIRAAFADAVEQHLIPSNPAALKSARPPRPGKPRVVVPQRDALRQLLELADDHNVSGPVVKLAPYVGYRRGEALGLEWPAVDLDKGTLRIGPTLLRVGGEVVWSDEPKTARGRRTIHLAPDAVTLLKAHKKVQNERRLALGDAWSPVDSDGRVRFLVFDNGTGGPIDPDAFSHWFRKLAKRAGVPGARLHDIRHAFVAMLAAEGVPPLVISEAVGHADIAFTLRQYGYLFDGAGKQVGEAIERAMSGGRA